MSNKQKHKKMDEIKAFKITVNLSVNGQTRGLIFYLPTDHQETIEKETIRCKKSILEDLEQIFTEDALDLQADGKIKTERGRWNYEKRELKKWENAKPQVIIEPEMLEVYKTDEGVKKVRLGKTGIIVSITLEQFLNR